MPSEVRPTNIGEGERLDRQRGGFSDWGVSVNVLDVLKQAAEWEWLLRHLSAEESGAREGPAGSSAGRRGEEGSDQAAEILSVLVRELGRLHAGIGGVAQAMGVRLFEIHGVEDLCGPSVLSALTGWSTDACGRALEREAKREAEWFRSKASCLRAQAVLVPEAGRWKLAGELDGTAEAIEDRPRSSLRVLKAAATALGLKLDTVYYMEGVPRSLADFVGQLDPGLYMVGVGDPTTSGHAVAIQIIGEARVWFADNGCRRPVPFSPSRSPLRQIDPGEIVWWCEQVDLPTAVSPDSELLGSALDRLAAILVEIEARIAVEDG